MIRLLIFGPGYTALRIARAVESIGGTVVTIGRDQIDDAVAVAREIAVATHILSSVPPDDANDPVLDRHGRAIASGSARWVGYLSSTGVYGDVGGAWIDESAKIAGRRAGRNAADAAWRSIHPQARVFRLPGIYGPGRSALDRVGSGTAHRIDLPGQVFSRIHVDDIVSGVVASFDRGPPGIYNLADNLPAPQNDVVAYAASLLGILSPPIVDPEAAALSPAARAFYTESRRIANGKAKRLLGWSPAHPTYREGLRACLRARSQEDI